MTDAREWRKRAYQKYLRTSRIKDRLPAFETFEGHFASEKSFTAIGEPYGLSREMVRKIHSEFFATKERPNGKFRIQQRAERIRRAKIQKRWAERFSAFVKEAEKHNVKAELYIALGKFSLIRINGHLCKFASVKRDCQDYYSPHYENLYGATILVVQAEDPGVELSFYFIPVSELPRRKYARIPVLPCSGYHKNQRPGLRQFKNRWDLVQETVQPEPAQLPEMYHAS